MHALFFCVLMIGLCVAFPQWCPRCQQNVEGVLVNSETCGKDLTCYWHHHNRGQCDNAVGEEVYTECPQCERALDEPGELSCHVNHEACTAECPTSSGDSQQGSTGQPQGSPPSSYGAYSDSEAPVAPRIEYESESEHSDTATS